MSTLKVNAVTNLAAETPYQPTLMTAQASTSGTTIDFANIPSWAKRICVVFSGVSTSGTSAILVQLGDSGGIETTGYATTAGVVRGTYAGAAGASNYTTGFGLEYSSQAGTFVMSGHLTLINISGSTWIGTGILGHETVGEAYLFSGSKTTSAAVDRVRITTVNGTDTFDAGSINVMYE